jgi:AcrR family transcriptional regulator
MSMRRIAAEIGCDPMAIYRHFLNRQALLDAVADLAIADVREPATAAAQTWDIQVRELLTEVRASALHHPGIAVHIASRPPLGSNGLRLAALLHQALADAGLPAADAARAGQALIAYTAAALRMAVLAGERDERWHQVTQAIGYELPVVGSIEQFDYGLRLLLGGIKAEIATGDE